MGEESERERESELFLGNDDEDDGDDGDDAFFYDDMCCSRENERTKEGKKERKGKQAEAD